MNIELKKVKIAGQISPGFFSFYAEIYVEGKNVAYVHSDGDSDRANIYPYTDDKENAVLLKQAETWAKSLPDLEHEAGTISMDLEFWIVLQIAGMVDDKNQLKKMKQKSRQWVVIYNEKTKTFISRGWQGHKLEDLLKAPKHLPRVKRDIRQWMTELKDGEIIFNENLQGLLAEIRQEAQVAHLSSH